MAVKSSPVRPMPAKSRKNQPGLARCQTKSSSVLLSVPSSWRPSISGGPRSWAVIALSAMAELRIGVHHPREIGRARARAELVQQVVAAFGFVHARDARLAIVEIAEADRARRARLLTD